MLLLFFNINNSKVYWSLVDNSYYDDIKVNVGTLEDLIDTYNSSFYPILVGKNINKKCEILLKYKNFAPTQYAEMLGDGTFENNITFHTEMYNLLDSSQFNALLSKNDKIYGYPGSGKKLLKKYSNKEFITTLVPIEPMLTYNYYINRHVAAFLNFCVIGNSNIVSDKEGNRPLILRKDCPEMLPFPYHVVKCEDDIKVCENMVLYDPYLVKAMFYVTGNLVIICDKEMKFEREILKYAKLLG